MEKKYRLLEDDTITVCGRTLYRIEALMDFANVKKGDKGGYVESENNLSQEGNCWVYNKARVFEDAFVCGDAHVYGKARVLGNAWVSGKAHVLGNAWVSGHCQIIDGMING